MRIVNIKDLYNYGRDNLKQSQIEDYDLIAKLIIEHVCKIDKNSILVHENDEVDKERCFVYKESIDQICKGKPVQYITNKQEFMGLNFYVDEDVLIPQPDTEIVVEEVINEYKDRECVILDLCTGSGAIGISLAKYVDKSKIVASDISDKAIQISKLNAEKNSVWKRMKFIESNMFENIDETEFDAIVSNPPYIETDVIDELSIQVKNEPYMALDGGLDGLKFYRIIADEAWKHVKDNGKIFLEIGYNQREAVENILKRNGKYVDIYSKKDLGDNDRIVVATVRR
ncbi:MAG: peptide chain release factor N(5)-glutamine methyltransferase [Clostridia bacterium]|nr:peptide chain release factor N(5)-glutamine methyltransferase [Clostridia bacterium]